jgi:TnpA family transposase
LIHTARMRARDDLAEMLCKRIAAIVKKARTELEEIRLRQRAVSERLIGTYRTVLEHLDPGGETAAQSPGQGAARAVAAVEEAGGFAAQLAGIEEVSAFHGDNYEVLVHRFFRKDRAVMFELAGKLDLVATSSDASVPAALEHVRAYHAMRRNHIPLPPPAGGQDTDSGLAFASGNWRRAVTDRRRPGMVVRRHFEAMAFTCLAEELRTGDIAVAGAGEYADWRASLLPWEECEPLLEGFCAGVGLPATAAGFTARLRHAHLDAAAALDAGYEDNADLVIGEGGVPALKRRRSAGIPQAAEKLAEAIARRMPERSLLSIVARTAYWLGWHHHFGPASGSDPKISDPLGRYCMAVFTGGANIGPYEAARHIAGVSARELSMVRNRHIDLKKLNAAIATVVNAFAELDVVKAWGDGTAVAADGAQVETYIDNLLAETSIRYGGVGGIAYHYVSDTYVALFSRFIPCGMWEAVYLIEGLLANTSDIQPTAVHADTQGQSAPVFTLATLFGFDLMPRIRNFKDLIFFRPSEHLIYPHIDELFGERGRNVIDWKLIERHWQDLMQVAISISAGRLSSATLMRRLRSNSRKNRIYKVFREVGRSVRTVALRGERDLAFRAHLRDVGGAGLIDAQGIVQQQPHHGRCAQHLGAGVGVAAVTRARAWSRSRPTVADRRRRTLEAAAPSSNWVAAHRSTCTARQPARRCPVRRASRAMPPRPRRRRGGCARTAARSATLPPGPGPALSARRSRGARPVPGRAVRPPAPPGPRRTRVAVQDHLAWPRW